MKTLLLVGARPNFMKIAPVNCGQQLYDVISITESRIGFAAEKKRVTGIYLSFNPAKGEYKQRLTLGEV